MKEKKSIQYQNEALVYTLSRSRQTKRLIASVRSDASVLVSAPLRASLKMIETFVVAHALWIVTQVEKRKIAMPRECAVPFESCKAQAKKCIRDRVLWYSEQYGFSFTRISIKHMRTRWGSCSSQGNLNFHFRLLFLPPELRDYVVVHELCHLRHMNHSAKFWQQVAVIDPLYQTHVAALKKYVL